MQIRDGVAWLTVVAVVALFSRCRASDPLQEVGQESVGTGQTIRDAVEWLAQDWQRWTLREDDHNAPTAMHKTQTSPDQSQRYKSPEGYQKDKSAKASTAEDQREKKTATTSTNRQGRMLNNGTEPHGAGRLFFGNLGTDQQITISLQGLIASIIYTILIIFLIKLIIAIVTGRDVGYWGRWANDWYASRFAPNYYPDDYTYTTYRHLQDAARKYD